MERIDPRFNDQAPLDEIPCGCGDPDCTIMDGDPSNVRIGRYLWKASCAHAHPVVCGELMAALKADERQDDFNRRRR